MSANVDLLEGIQDKTWFSHLHNKIPQDLLILCDPNEDYYWDKVDEKNIKYFVRQCVGHPWANQYALALMCLSNRNLTPQSIMNITSVLNARFRDLFNHFKLSSMEEFLPLHVEQYVTGKILPEHSDRQRQSILTSYNTFMFNLKKWLGTKFSEEKQVALSAYLLPNLPYDNRDFNARTRAITNAKSKRKEDTSAVTPLLPEIRAEGHLRWNQVSRLREAFRKAIANVREERLALPIEFHYDESEYAGERWHFILRDLNGIGQFKGVKKCYREFKDEDCVLEFVKAEKLDDGSEGEGPWFLELLRLRLLGNWSTEYISDEHREKATNYLNNWGYEIEDGGKTIAPFLPRNPGLLIQGFDTTRTSRLTNKLLINIEPIYVACMFARFALDIITSSGARMNELLQISYDKDCCVVTVDKSVNPPRKNYIFRLTPKGREEPENFYMPEEVFKFMTQILKMLKESYKADTIPEVQYDVESRRHLMSKRKYIFQYQSRHINVFSINAILRFLLHGIVSEKVGTMSKVVGGICTIDSVCPTKMACVGCGAKVPRPEFKEEITAFYNWAEESEKRFEQLGLPLEAKKMKIAKNRAKNELKEIQLIENSQKDESYAPQIRISSNK